MSLYGDDTTFGTAGDIGIAGVGRHWNGQLCLSHCRGSCLPVVDCVLVALFACDVQRAHAGAQREFRCMGKTSALFLSYLHDSGHKLVLRTCVLLVPVRASPVAVPCVCEIFYFVSPVQCPAQRNIKEHWRAGCASPHVARVAREARLSVNPAAHGRRGSCSTGCGHRCGKSARPLLCFRPRFTTTSVYQSRRTLPRCFFIGVSQLRILVLSSSSKGIERGRYVFPYH